MIYQILVSKILSLLSAKEAVRTSVMSKAWEYQWTSINTIKIDDSELVNPYGSTRKYEAVDFIVRIIILCNGPRKTFHLSLPKQHYNSGDMARWIKYILLKEVEDLKISFNHEGLVLPRSLFTSTSLTKLDLQSLLISQQRIGYHT
ncbi:F-box/FBD/LRR-repeat protein-like [Dorcoceras hygrometricum]|uniref:F-box/FBD/LRR-repeat protein-like n=1 Tax=Dorcoceras hygrometricum TaxID=472368 RepID=A0A2Z7CKY7_9LAMI|nr:F-box/FBD/LRR-repeat protein-like [Dorcoceras hygrometricum]